MRANETKDLVKKFKFQSISSVAILHTFQFQDHCYYCTQTRDGYFYLGFISMNQFYGLKKIKLPGLISCLQMTKQHLYFGFCNGSLAFLDIKNVQQKEIEWIKFQVKSDIKFFDKDPDSQMLYNVYDSKGNFYQLSQKGKVISKISIDQSIYKIKIAQSDNSIDLYCMMLLDQLYLIPFSIGDFHKIYNQEFFVKYADKIRQQENVRGIIIDFQFSPKGNLLVVGNSEKQIVVYSIERSEKKRLMPFDKVMKLVFKVDEEIISVSFKKKSDKIGFITKDRIYFYDLQERKKVKGRVSQKKQKGILLDIIKWSSADDIFLCSTTFPQAIIYYMNFVNQIQA